MTLYAAGTKPIHMPVIAEWNVE